MATKPEKDEISGMETTGHEWDGIKELNTPLPRWWLWTFYLTCIWSLGYVILMPAIPLIDDYTKGMLGFSQRANVAAEIAEAKQGQEGIVAKIGQSELNDILNDSQMLEFAQAGGRSAFAVNCSQCHGSGAAGSKGYPNLNDDNWLWGGDLDAIYQTIAHGIRADNDDTRTGDMPAFGRDEMLDGDQSSQVVEYVLALSGQDNDNDLAEEGKAVFTEQCASCHNENGKGNMELGAPDLTDGIWLYGGDRESIAASVHGGRLGMMPAWSGRLDESTLKQLTVYVHSLGGGQ